MKLSRYLHRLLLKSYPREFRDEFGGEMARDFDAQLRSAGLLRLPILWWRTIADWLISMPREQLDITRQDLRDCFRSLRRSPAFTLVVVLSLAVGIGANAVVFTVANTLLLQTPLDKDTSRFAGVVRGEGLSEPSSWPDYVDYRDRNRSFEGFVAWTILPVGFGRGQRSESVMAEAVTDNYFAVLELKPFLGRLFAPGDCPATCAAEVILSHRYWRRAYAGDPGVIGRQFPLSGVPATVAGIAPPEFDGTLAPVMTDIWIHLGNRRLTDPELFTNRRLRWLVIGGRLKDGVTSSQAVAELNAIDGQLRSEYQYTPGENRRLWMPQTPGIGIPHIRRRVMMGVSILGALSGLLLAVCCANVANMTLARAAARRQENAMRHALGAGASRLVRHSLTESLVLALLGGAAGFAVSHVLALTVPLIQPPANDLYTYRVVVRQDLRVYAFTLLVSLASGIVFGLLPALRAAREDAMQAIRNLDERGRPRFLAHKALVSCQVALSVVLLVAAGLFLRSLARQQEIFPGFSAAKGLIVPLNLNLVSYHGKDEKVQRFFATVKEKVTALPGVRSAAFTSYVPLNALAPAVEVHRGSSAPVRASLSLIDPGYAGVMNLEMIGGRNFSEHDSRTSQAVAIIDERLARHLWTEPLESLGRTIMVDDRPAQVVGVMRSELRRSLTEPALPAVFLPVAQRSPTMLYLVVRSMGSPDELMVPIARIVESVDDAVSLRRMRTLETQVRDVLWPIRTGFRAVAFIGALALFLGAAGMYGLVAYWISKRRREMGIRVALGAQTADVVRTVVGQGVRISLAGIAFGLPLAVAANIVLARLLYGLRPVEPAVAAGVAVVWLAIACAACAPPALRAARNASAAIRDPG